MAKKKDQTELKDLTKEWHENVVDDTPDKKFVSKREKASMKAEVPGVTEDANFDKFYKAPEEPDYEEASKEDAAQTSTERPIYQWVDDWTLLSEVTKTNKELRGYGNSKKWVTVFYGPLK